MKIDLVKYMESSFAENLSLEDYARDTGRSLSTFNRDFRRIFGLSPGRWITLKRLGRARELLQEGALNVGEAASEAGFINLSHFSRAYRSEFGVAPSEDCRRVRGLLADNCVESVCLCVRGTYGHDVNVGYYISDERALVEANSIAEPSRMPDPMKSSTFGVGQIILDALDRGVRDFYIGTHGCASSDAGTGLLFALGVRFLDADGNALEGTGESLEKIVSIDMSSIDQRLLEAGFIVSCDVNSPVGLDEPGLANFVRLVRRQFGIDLTTLEGSSAGGGLAGGLAAFLRARLSYRRFD